MWKKCFESDTREQSQCAHTAPHGLAKPGHQEEGSRLQVEPESIKCTVQEESAVVPQQFSLRGLSLEGKVLTRKVCLCTQHQGYVACCFTDSTEGFHTLMPRPSTPVLPSLGGGGHWPCLQCCRWPALSECFVHVGWNLKLIKIFCFSDEYSSPSFGFQNQWPVVDAEVLVDGARVAKTDSAGRYLLQNVQPGRHSVTVQKEGVEFSKQNPIEVFFCVCVCVCFCVREIGEPSFVTGSCESLRLVSPHHVVSRFTPSFNHSLAGAFHGSSLPQWVIWRSSSLRLSKCVVASWSVSPT